MVIGEIRRAKGGKNNVFTKWCRTSSGASDTDRDGSTHAPQYGILHQRLREIQKYQMGAFEEKSQTGMALGRAKHNLSSANSLLHFVDLLG